MAAIIRDGALYVTKSVRIPLDSVFVVRYDHRLKKAFVVTDQGRTIVEESLDEMRKVLPDLVVD